MRRSRSLDVWCTKPWMLSSCRSPGAARFLLVKPLQCRSNLVLFTYLGASIKLSYHDEDVNNWPHCASVYSSHLGALVTKNRTAYTASTATLGSRRQDAWCTKPGCATSILSDPGGGCSCSRKILTVCCSYLVAFTSSGASIKLSYHHDVNIAVRCPSVYYSYLGALAALKIAQHTVLLSSPAALYHAWPGTEQLVSCNLSWHTST